LVIIGRIQVIQTEKEKISPNFFVGDVMNGKQSKMIQNNGI